LAIMLIFVAIGADEIIDRIEKSKAARLEKIKKPAIKTSAIGFAFFFLIIYGAVPVVFGNRHPDFREPYEVAIFLNEHLSSNERAVIIGKSIDGAVPMPYQRIFGQLTFDKEHLLCSALLGPKTVGNVNNFVRERSVRYVAVFGGDWSRSGSDAIFMELVGSPKNKTKAVFKNQTAVIHELSAL